MSKDEFDEIVWAAFERLPAWVHDGLDNVELVIDDRATPELLPDGEDLLGLYLGTPLTERSVEDVFQLPDVIYIFRETHLQMGWSADELREQIGRTLIHEIAHHFGIDDDHLDEIGWG